MKVFLTAIAALCMLFFTGCVTFNETESPVLTAKFSKEAKLHLEGFQLYSVREKEYHVGYTSGSAYNFRTDSWILDSDSYSGTTYARLLDEQFPGIVKDIFESSGANIRTQTPELTLEGRISDGRYMWNSSEMWYRDAPIFVVTVCTLGMLTSRERENDVKLLVYNKDGKRLKEYTSTATYYTGGFGLPLSHFINDKVRIWYCDRMAAKFALINCVNQFIRDYNNGIFQ